MTTTAVLSVIAVLAFSALPASAQTSDRSSFAERAAAIRNSPYGEVAGRFGTSGGGIVVSPPFSPPVGTATVSRQFDLEQILGSSVGVGAEFKASDNFFVRASIFATPMSGITRRSAAWVLAERLEI